MNVKNNTTQITTKFDLCVKVEEVHLKGGERSCKKV